MNASDVMTRKVISVGPDTPIEDIARLLLDHRISGVPVVQFGAVAGIISEGDLVRRAAAEGTPAPSGWLDLFTSSATRAAAYVRSHGRRARDVMTAPAVSVPADTPINDIARLMEERRLKRVPVVDGDGMLVGIVTRANLLQAFASQAARARPAAADDAAIRHALIEELTRQGWSSHADPANIIVEDGVVHLWGRVRDPQVRRALVVAAEATAGVRNVADHLDTALDAIDPLDRPNWPSPGRP